MKVTQQSEPKFIPVVITLESQEEVDILTSLVGAVTGNGLVRKCVGDIYFALERYSSHMDERIDTYFTGTISAKHIKP